MTIIIKSYHLQEGRLQRRLQRPDVLMTGKANKKGADAVIAGRWSGAPSRGIRM